MQADLKLDIELLKDFEKSLDTSNPEKGTIPINLLGFGEISLVFEIIGEKSKNIAYKRLPIFDNEEQVVRHINGYDKYNKLLHEEIGLIIPRSGASWIYIDEEKKKDISLYCAQEKVPPESIGNRVIHQLSESEIQKLVLIIMREMKKVWDFNRIHKDKKIGLDGQISNWSLVDYNEDSPKIQDDQKLIYLDTSTPMIKENGEDVMEPVLFLKSAPSFLRWLVKWLFLEEVVDRYYEWRLVTIDLLANFYKEQMPEVIPALIKTVNEFFSDEAKESNIELLSLEELSTYYKHDKMIWVLFQNFRRFDRFLQTKILRRKYDFYLPGKIKR